MGKTGDILAGHYVAMAPPCGGWLRSCIVVNEKLTSQILGEPRYCGRSVVIDFCIGGWKPITLASAHLHPHSGVGDFMQTLDDLHAAISAAHGEGHVLIGVDAED